MNEFDDLLRTAINSCIPADKKNIKDKLVKFSNIENASKYSHILKILNLITDGNKDIKILDFGCGGGVPLTLLQMSGYKNTYGAKHTAVFTDSVKNTGWLNEFQLPLRTFGIFNVFKLLGLLPILLDALVSRKVPPVFHHKLPSVSSIQRIFKKVDLQITKRE